MFNFTDINIQPLITFFHAHPHYAGLFAFFVVFLEALAVVGVIIPGTITMPLIGVLIGSRVIPAGATFLWAISGAILGDYLSYVLGIILKNRIHRIWPFTRWPKLLTTSENFFRKHGGTSVFFGRFVGPTRAMIPMVAGVFKMPLGRFLFAAIPSAALWAVGYMIPGILLGALSLELPPKVATKFTVVIILLAIAFWVVIWLLQHFFKRICRVFNHYIKIIWNYLQRHRTLKWVTVVLADPRESENHHQQLTLLLGVVICAGLFFVLLQQVISHGILTQLNQPLYHLLRSFRFARLDKVMIAITILGENYVIGTAAALFLGWLVWTRNWYIAAHWFGLMVLTIGSIGEFKMLVYSIRPDAVINTLPTCSFPSGHTILSITFFGFLAMIIAREMAKQQRFIPYSVAAGLIGTIAFSRIYLNAHWLTDVLGGIFFGLALVLLVALAYRRRHIYPVAAHKFIIAIVTIFLTTWLIFCLVIFHKQQRVYSLQIQPITIQLADWRNLSYEIPIVRLGRLGDPIDAFNVQWLGDLSEIRHTLQQQGWQDLPVKLDFLGIVKNFTDDTLIYHQPLFPQLYHDRSLQLLMLKSTEHNGLVLILRLWQSDVKFTDFNLPLWIGCVESYHEMDKKIFSLHRLKHKAPFIGATNFLARDLTNFRWQELLVATDKLPVSVADLRWDGKLLLIMPKNTISINNN